MKHKIITFLLLSILLFAMATTGPSFAVDQIKVFVNGNQIEFDVNPVIENSRTLVPLRAIFEALDAKVSWDATTKTVTGIKDTRTIVLKVDSKNALVNGENKVLDAAASIRNGRTLVPLRFISESLGAMVNWNSTTKTITINEQVLKPLIVSFVDVGQADCIFIKTPGGSSVLIDAGNNADENTVLSYIKSQGVSKIDAVVGTHPHEDHIGSLDAVINQFDIGSIYLPKVTSTTKTFEDMINSISKKGLKIDTAQAGKKIEIDSNIDIEILAPNNTNYEDLNNYSAVVKLTYKNVSYLFCGDAEAISENEMISKNYNIKADVIKCGHHGSLSSTTESFLKRVSPKYAVISVGKDNDYGHPAQETLDKLNKAGIKIYRTDDAGTIISTSDGNTIVFDKSASPIKPQGPPKSSIVPATPTPQITITPMSTPTPKISNDNVIVYITKTGEKYHSSECRYLSKSRIPITLTEAKENGYIPCSVCHPPY